MATLKPCCDELQEHIRNEDIQVWGVSGDSPSVQIYGAPRFANDGGGHFDNMTWEIEIKFCPFCGSAIVFLERE